MVDRYYHNPGNKDVRRPGQKHLTVTLSDTADLAESSRGLLITTAAAIKLELVDDPAGTATTYAAGELVVGVLHPLRVRRIWSTGTALTTAQIRLIG